MVRDLEFRSVQDQLDRQVANAAVAVRTQECLQPNAPGTTLCRPDSTFEFTDRLNSKAPTLGIERLILLDNERYIVYDSVDPSTVGRRAPPLRAANDWKP